MALISTDDYAKDSQHGAAWLLCCFPHNPDSCTKWGTQLIFHKLTPNSSLLICVSQKKCFTFAFEQIWKYLMNMNNLDIFEKLRHIIFCWAYCLLNLENFKKSGGLQRWS